MSMMRCETCGNEYDKPMMIVYEGRTYAFDSFECAIHKLAPSCTHCGVRVIGHGLEEDGRIYCCAHCAHHEGDVDVKDRFEHRASQ